MWNKDTSLKVFFLFFLLILLSFSSGVFSDEKNKVKESIGKNIEEENCEVATQKVDFSNEIKNIATCADIKKLHKDDNVDYWRVQGRTIIDSNNNVIELRGINLGNSAWDFWGGNSGIKQNEHDAKAYQDIASLGMNSVRFLLNSIWFECVQDEKDINEEVFLWIDQEIQEASDAGLKIILNMHYPPGGSLGSNPGFWYNPEQQKRLMDLWNYIAMRYSSNPNVIGYGLINEPCVVWEGSVDASIALYEQYINQLVTSIRKYDKNHIIFVEEVINFYDVANKQKYYSDKKANFCLINDDNVVYEGHFYGKYPFTHQGVNGIQTGIVYPDVTYPSIHDSKYVEYFGGNGVFVELENGWKHYESGINAIKDKSVNNGCYILELWDDEGCAKAYFDNIIVKEFDENGQFLRNVYEERFDMKNDMFPVNASYSFNDFAGTISISSVNGYGKVAISNEGNKQYFVVNPEHKYQLSYDMKVERGGNNAKANVFISMNTCEKITYFDKEYLKNEIQSYIDFQNNKGVPVYIGEFGATDDAMPYGGCEWTADLLDIFIENHLSFSLFAFKGPSWGLIEQGTNFSNAKYLNEELVSMIKEKLK